MSARKLLITILITALALRAVAAVVVTRHVEGSSDPFLIAGDAAGYWELGQHVARGEPYQIIGGDNDELARKSLPRQVARMPGFPALLAVSIRIFGESQLAARLLLALVGTLACGLVYLLGARLFSTRVGLVAAACCAVSPTLAGFSVLVLSETLFAVMLLLCLLATSRLVTAGRTLEDPPRLLTAATVGLTAVAACYVRPGWLAAVPLFALLWIGASRPRRRTLLEAAVVLLVLFIGLLPWAWRNQQVSGHPVFTTLWGGPSLYDGLNPRATGASDMRFIKDHGLFAQAEMTEYKIDQHYRREAWDFTASHPGQAVQLALKKVWRFLKPWPSADQFGQPWQLLLVATATLPLYILAMRGCWRVPVGTSRFLIVAGPLLYFTALHMVFVGSLRYRVPVEYPLWILAAVGCSREVVDT